MLGVPPTLVQLIASFHADMTAKIRVGDGHTDSILVTNGLRQGCSMAPVLFNLFFSLVFERWRSEMAELCPGHAISFCFNAGNLYNRPRSRHHLSSSPDLEFADDAVLTTPSRATAQLTLITFSLVATAFGLTVNFVKTKFMACGFGLCTDDYQPLTVMNQAVEHVSTFIYLGSLLSPDVVLVMR